VSNASHAPGAEMDVDNLVRMANRIGEFFASMPDGDAARDDIAQHLRRFWEPRMRRAIVARVDGGGDGLSEIVLDAIRRHRAELAP
jgi:formate dehydrogenase subunit delta